MAQNNALPTKNENGLFEGRPTERFLCKCGKHDRVRLVDNQQEVPVQSIQLMVLDQTGELISEQVAASVLEEIAFQQMVQKVSLFAKMLMREGVNPFGLHD